MEIGLAAGSRIPVTDQGGKSGVGNRFQPVAPADLLQMGQYYLNHLLSTQIRRVDDDGIRCRL